MICTCGIASKKDVPTFPWHCACGVVWTSTTTRRRGPCIHLGEKTGDTIKCRTCGNRESEVPVYRCAIEGTTLLRKPTPRAGQMPWDGAVCVTCELREDE